MPRDKPLNSPDSYFPTYKTVWVRCSHISWFLHCLRQSRLSKKTLYLLRLETASFFVWPHDSNRTKTTRIAADGQMTFSQSLPKELHSTKTRSWGFVVCLRMSFA